jgi:hypothetical protein
MQQDSSSASVSMILISFNADYEELFLLGYSAVLSVEIQLTFRRSMFAPLALSKNRRRRHFFENSRLTFNRLHGVICQKTKLLF